MIMPEATYRRMFPPALAGWAGSVLLAVLLVCGGEISVAGAEQVEHPYRGVTLITRSEILPRAVNLCVVLVDLAAPGIRFKLTSPGGTRETVRQRTVDFLEAEQAQLAVNTHFYVPVSDLEPNVNLAGLAVSEGRVYSPFEPQPVAPGLAFQAYAILPFAPALNLDPSNHAAIVHFDATDTNGTQTVERVRLWNAVAGSAQIVTAGRKTIPEYSGPPGGLTPFFIYSATNSWYDLLRARAVIGLSHGGATLVLFTVDEAGGSVGLTPGEAADILIRDYGVEEALNLDGSVSTALALADPFTQRGRLVNVSSAGAGGRGVGCNLAVFAQPQPGRLRLARSGAGPSFTLTLSWPVDEAAWFLERSAGLGGRAAWERWNVSPARRDGWETLTLIVNPDSGGAGGYYRLVR